MLVFSASIVLGVAGDILLRPSDLLGDDRVQHRVQQRDVRARLEREVLPGVARQRLPARVDDDELGAALLDGVLDESRGDRVIDRRVRADDDDALRRPARRRTAPTPRRSSAPPSARRPRRHGTAACNDRRCWSRSRCAPASGRGRPPRSSPSPSRSRRAPSGPCASRMRARPPAARSSASSQLASRKCVNGLAGSTWSSASFGVARQAHQRLRQPMRMVDVVEAEPSFDAEPVVIGRAVLALRHRRCGRP